MTRAVRKPIVFLLSFMLVITYTFGGGSFAFAETYSDSDKDKAAVEQDLQKDAEPAAQNEEADAAEDVQQNSGAAEAAPAQEAQGAVEEAAAVAFAESATVEGVDVKVTADKGVFPEGATLKVKKLSAKEEAAAKKAIDKIADKADVAKQYNFDISVFDKNGNEIQPDTSKGSVNVAFKTDEVADDSLKAEVFHIPDNGNAEALDVETKGEVAKVETEGFSAYSLRFLINGSTLEYDLAYGQTVRLTTILDALGVYSYGYITSASPTSGSPVSVEKVYEENDYYVSMSPSTPSGSHAIQVEFSQHSDVAILIDYHQHAWELTPSGNSASLRCTDTYQHCPYYNQTFNATLSANGGVYKGSGHPYGATLNHNMPTSDVDISAISYYKVTTVEGQEVETLLGSAPYVVGNYRAKVTITPHGGTSATISTDYSITKADINLTESAACELIYNGSSQTLHTAASAKSSTTEETFTVYYKLATEEQGGTTLRQAKDAGTYTITYWAYGDSNHNSSEVKTLTATIAKKPLTVKGIKAENRIYDSTKVATLNYSARTVEGVVAGESITVTATGTFDNKNAANNKTVTLSDFVMHAGNVSTKADNYTINTAQSETTTTANISKKMLLVDWTNATELQYNGEPQAPTAVIIPGDASNDEDGKIYAGDDVTVNLRADSYNTEVGGPYEAHLTNLSGDDAGNYYLDDAYSHTGGKYSIVPRDVDVVWTDLSQEYDARELAPNATVDDDVFAAEDVKVDIALDPTPAINAGTYKATASLSGENAGNFVINSHTEKADFTITKAPLTVKAKGWIYYGTHVQADTNTWINEPEYDIPNPDQFKGDDGVEVLTDIQQGTVRFDTDYEFLDPATGVTNPKTGEPAEYYLYPEFDAADNYEITNADGELTVYPKPVTLEWTHTHNGESEVVSGDQSFVYDGKKHTYTAEVTEDSYVKIDGEPYIPKKLTVTLQANIQRDANVKTETEKYTAYAAELDNPNYALQEIVKDKQRTKKDVETRYQDFFIDQLPIELSWKPAEFTYNAESQRPVPTVANLQTDDEGTVDEPFEITFTPEESINADDYVAKVTDLADLNYSILATPTDPMSDLVPTSAFAYTIKKAPLTIQPVVDPISYKDAAPAEYEPSVEGLQGEDTVDSIGLELDRVTFTCPYVKNEKPGNYSVETTMEPVQELQNYEIMLNNGTLAVKDKVTKIVAKATAKGKKKGVVTWNAVTGAKSYTVYMSKCNKGKKHYKLKKVATVKGTKYTTKKLKKKSCYKIKVVANTDAGSITSLEAHFATGNVHGKYTNTKKLTVNRSSVTLNQGKAFKLKCKATKVKKGKRLNKHAKRFRFISDNPEVAKVSAGGTITAVGHGWCRVYVQAVNGMWKTVQVNVN